MQKFRRATAALLGTGFALALLSGCERRQPTPDVTTTAPPATTTTTPSTSPMPDPPASPASPPSWPASPASQ